MAHKTTRARVYAAIRCGDGDTEGIAQSLELSPRQLESALTALVKQGRIKRVSRGKYRCSAEPPSVGERPGRPVPRSYLPADTRARMARKILDGFVSEELKAREQRNDLRPLTTRQFDRAVSIAPIATDDALKRHDRAALRARADLLVEELKRGRAEFWRVGDTAVIAYDEQAAPRMALLRDCQSNIRAILATGILTHGIGSIDNLALLAASWAGNDRDLADAGHALTAADRHALPLDKKASRRAAQVAHIVETRSALRRRGLVIATDRVRNAPALPDLDAARRLMADCGLTLWPERVDGRAWYIESLGPVSGPTAVGLVAHLDAIA